MTEFTIAIDAMGGDLGLEVTIPASLRTLKKYPQLKLILVGDQTKIERALSTHANQTHANLEIQHASEEVLMDESPAVALRSKKDSSMRVAINLVKQGVAQACVSAGNTGALMATARFVLKTLPGVDRPALMTTFPTLNKHHGVRVLDLGANVDSTADHLYQFAVMGSIVVAAVEEVDSPRVGLLNIGEEDIKGNEVVKATAALLAESTVVNYVGNVEGNRVFANVADVVVCDGFTGNVALKMSEGLARLIMAYAKESLMHSWYTKLIAFLAKPILKNIKNKVDPGRYNGASLLGLNGIVIKSHGSADVPAFANAIDEAMLEIDKNIPKRIRDQVAKLLEDEAQFRL